MAIGRISTHYALVLDAKAAIAFPARRECGTGGPTRHVAQTLTKCNVSMSRLRPHGDGSTPLLEASASVPMLNQTEQQAHDQQVLAKIFGREALLTAAEREIELELWRATQLAAGEAENVRASRRLLDNANMAYTIVIAPFTSTVGSILEMLSAQNASASANSSATQAQNHGAGNTHPFESGVRSHANGDVSARGRHQKNGLLQRSPSRCHNACRVTPMPGW